MNNFYDALKEGGRYDQVQSMITKLMTDVDGRCDHSLFIHYNNADSVNGKDVITGLSVIQMVTATDTDPIGIFKTIYMSNEELSKVLNAVYAYVQSMASMHLHNYAITISHRKSDFDTDMERIRVWLILESLCFNIMRFVDDNMSDDEIVNEINSWYIPDGWKNKDTVDNSRGMSKVADAVEGQTPYNIIEDVISKLRKLQEISVSIDIPIITGYQHRNEGGIYL